MKKYISLILLILWMIIIFIMSNFNSDASSNQSSFIIDILNKIIKIENIDFITFIIRKLAHLTEYLILGILMINCLKNFNIKSYFSLSIILCIMYAYSDEIHQLFISGRNGKIIDVIIDSIGSILGIIIYKKLLSKKNNNDKIIMS